MTLNPVLRIGEQMMEAILTHADVPRAQALDAAAKRWKWWASLARKAPEELSARVLRRHAPARGHRHRHAEQARPDHLRRAHHRAGRHHPGPDPYRMQEICRQHNTALIWITHDLGVVAELADRVAVVCRPHRRERPGRAGAGSAAPSIHARPAGLDAGRHAARRAPAPDQRHGAQPVRRPRAVRSGRAAPARSRAAPSKPPPSPPKARAASALRADRPRDRASMNQADTVIELKNVHKRFEQRPDLAQRILALAGRPIDRRTVTPSTAWTCPSAAARWSAGRIGLRQVHAAAWWGCIARPRASCVPGP